MSHQHEYKKNSVSDSSGYDSKTDSENEEPEKIKSISKRSPKIKLGATSEQLLKLIPYLYGRLASDFDINTLRINDYPTVDTGYKFRAYLIQQGVIVSDGFNYTSASIHAEEDVINRFLKRSRNLRNGGLTKNIAKWQRILRTNAEECVQRRRKKVVQNIKVDIQFGIQYKEEYGIRGFRSKFFRGDESNRTISCCT